MSVRIFSILIQHQTSQPNRPSSTNYHSTYVRSQQCDDDELAGGDERAGIEEGEDEQEQPAKEIQAILEGIDHNVRIVDPGWWALLLRLRIEEKVCIMKRRLNA